MTDAGSAQKFMDGAAHDTARLFLGDHGKVKRTRKVFFKGFALSAELSAPVRDDTYLSKRPDGQWALGDVPGGLRIRYDAGRFVVTANKDAAINMKPVRADTQINPRDDLTYRGDRFSFRHTLIEETRGQKRKLASADAPAGIAEQPSPS